MRNYLAIVRKELHTLFVSPIAYVVLAVFFLVTSFFFYVILTNVIERVMDQGMMAQQFGGPAPKVDVPAVVMANFFSVLNTILLFVIPIVTMGVIAEERKRGTIELLLTSPITQLQLILGKFTGLLLFLAVMLAPTIGNSILLYFVSDPSPHLAPFLIGYLGAFLLGGALLAIGTFISSLTENQIVAAVLTFGVSLLLWVLDAVADTGDSLGAQILRYVSVLNQYEDFAKGVFDTQHLVFYLSIIFLGLFFTSVSLNSAKWRQ
jgi:ABC-2 type transport system permease protein